MTNDHPDRYNVPVWHNNMQSQRLFGKKNRPRAKSGPVLWRTVGALIIAVLIGGVASTLWFGNRIRSALDDIGKAKVVQTELVTRNNELQVRREQLLDRAHIETVARGLGLYPPAADQKRTP